MSMNWMEHLRNVLNDEQTVKEQSFAITKAKKALVIHDYCDVIQSLAKDYNYAECQGSVNKVKYIRENYGIDMFKAHTLHEHIQSINK